MTIVRIPLERELYDRDVATSRAELLVGFLMSNGIRCYIDRSSVSKSMVDIVDVVIDSRATEEEVIELLQKAREYFKNFYFRKPSDVGEVVPKKCDGEIRVLMGDPTRPHSIGSLLDLCVEIRLIRQVEVVEEGERHAV